jgi:hypothetical protein
MDQLSAGVENPTAVVLPVDKLEHRENKMCCRYVSWVAADMGYEFSPAGHLLHRGSKSQPGLKRRMEDAPYVDKQRFEEEMVERTEGGTWRQHSSSGDSVQHR